MLAVTVADEEKFQLPASRRFVMVSALLVSAGVFIYLLTAGSSVKILGVATDGDVARVALLLLALVSVMAASVEVVKFAAHVPDASLTGEELVVRQFLRWRRVRWTDIASIDEPVDTSMSFGSRLTTITITSRTGRRWRLVPPCEATVIPEFHRALVRCWRSATHGSASNDVPGPGRPRDLPP